MMLLEHLSLTFYLVFQNYMFESFLKKIVIIYLFLSDTNGIHSPDTGFNSSLIISNLDLVDMEAHNMH